MTPNKKTNEEIDAETAKAQQQRQANYDRAQRGAQPNPDADPRTAAEKWLYDQFPGKFHTNPPTYDGWLDK